MCYSYMYCFYVRTRTLSSSFVWLELEIRRVRLPRVAIAGNISYDRLVAIAISYTFPGAPLVPEDYDVTFTYYDVDNDCVTIASTEELVDAIGQFSGVLRITADVKRKKNRPIPLTPPRINRVAEAPGTPPSNGPTNVAAQLQSILESFVSILATAVVALQSHVNPAPSVSNSAASGEARVTTDAPTTTEADLKVADALNDGHSKKKRYLENLKNDIDRLKRAEPEERPLDPDFIPDARPCAFATVMERATTDALETELTKDEPSKDEKPPAAERLFIHGRHTCDRCLSTPIVGKRFHATNLPDYDLCEKCKDGYKGTEIQFEAVELDRDRPFQERWHRKRARFAAAGHCGRHGGPRGAQRFPHVSPHCRRRGGGGPMAPCRRHPEPMDLALKEAIRRSLQDVNKAPEPTAIVEEAPTPSPEKTKPAVPVEEHEAAAPAAVEVKIHMVEEPTSTASFSLDAVGNGLVAEVLGQTLDQCADAIDAMVMEINRTSTNSTCDTATTDVVEEEQEEYESTHEVTIDDEYEFSEEEAEIVVETVTEDDDDASNAPDSVAEVTDSATAGATILEPIDPDGTCEEESVKSERSEEEWEVVSDDEQVKGDEMLARAAQLIGSSLFESDMARSDSSSLTGGVDSSVLSSVPTIASVSVPAVLLDRWAPQLVQLRELGFVDDAQSVDILERLNAANIGVNSDEEISVERVVDVLLKND